MNYYVGLDVSCKTVFVCMINEKGEMVREIELVTDPDAIHSFLLGTGFQIEKIGLESGSMTHWLTKGLRSYGYEVHPMESRKMAAILATIVNKTDKNDARGIAEALRAGHYKQCVHRSDSSMNLRTVLNSRDLLVKQRTQLTNSIRGFIRTYGIRLPKGRGKDFHERVLEAIEGQAEEILFSIEILLKTYLSLEEQISKFDIWLKRYSSQSKQVSLLKSVDGVGDITALAYITEVDDPNRFSNSRDVAAYIGLTPNQYSSGETQKQGRISKQGSSYLRFLLIEAATVLLTRCKQWSPIKSWGLKLMKKKGKKKAIVAVARKLAVTMHSMLLSEKNFNRKGKSKRLDNAEKAA